MLLFKHLQKCRCIFYIQIVRNDDKLSNEVERNHEKKLKVRLFYEKRRHCKDF